MQEVIDKRELEFMNSSLRQFFQKHHEFRLFKKNMRKHGIDISGGKILDAGCGSGYSSELILNYYKPKELIAFDIMAEQIEAAKRRNLPIDFQIGDITQMNFKAEEFDAVFVFGILHHVPLWPSALAEINRVLKLGGVLLVEEPNKKALDDAEKFFHIHHPKEARFRSSEFRQAVENAGFDILEIKKIYFGHFMSFTCKKTKQI